MSLQQIQQDCARQESRLEEAAGRAAAMGLDDLAARLRDAAAQARAITADAHQPVRVGLIGAFNAGKTRLLECLLGCAGRLNVAAKPSTGNIVEFVLKVGDVRETALENWRVEFMAGSGRAAEVLKRLLGRGRSLQNQESGDAELDSLLTAAEPREGSSPRWAEAQAWAVAAHARARAKQLKAVAFEVYRLAYAVNQAAPWLGKTFKVSEAQAVAGLMSLDYNPQEIYQTGLEKWRADPPALPAGDSLDGTPAEKLKALFPLVRKVIIDATLPREVAAPFAAGGRVEFRLTDCPGAGADGTNFRDEVLCAEELREVDTVFALINAKNTGENRAYVDELLRLWGPAARDRILVVLSRFDELEHDKDRAEGKRDAFAAGAGPLAERDVLDAIPVLNNQLAAAKDTVMDGDAGRVCFVSSMGYLTERLLEEKKPLRGTAALYEGDLKFQRGQSLAKWDWRRLPWAVQMGQWGRLASRLPADAELTGLLQDFAGDGGFGRMHRALQGHLSRHGQANLLARLTADAEAVAVVAEELLAELAREEAARPDTPQVVQSQAAAGPEPLSEAEAVARLSRAYDMLGSSAGRRFELKRPPAGSVHPVPVRRAIERWVVFTVCRWREWRLLMDRVRGAEPGLVKLVDPENPELKEYPQELQDERDTPVRSDEFLKPFRDTLTRVRKELRSQCQQAVRLHAEGLQKDLEVELGGRDEAGRVRAALEGLGPREGGLALAAFAPAESLDAAGWLEADLPEADDDAAAVRKAERFFPLQLGQNGELGKPFYYAWHKPLNDQFHDQFTDRHRHLMYVIKLRQTVIAAALEWLTDTLHAVQERLARSLDGHTRRLTGDLRAWAAETAQDLETFDDEFDGPAE